MSKFLKLAGLICLLSVSQANLLDDYGFSIFNPEEEKGKAVEEELSGPGGMIYSVPKTIEQYKSLMTGF